MEQSCGQKCSATGLRAKLWPGVHNIYRRLVPVYIVDAWPQVCFQSCGRYFSATGLVQSYGRKILATSLTFRLAPCALCSEISGHSYAFKPGDRKFVATVLMQPCGRKFLATALPADLALRRDGPLTPFLFLSDGNSARLPMRALHALRPTSSHGLCRL